MARASGYEALATTPVPLDHATLQASARPARCSPRMRGRPGTRRSPLGERARLPQRAGDRDRADRHDRPRHGLRHHRHRARFRAGEVQEARRRRLFQDHQPRGARSAAHARLSREPRSPRSRPMPSAMARSQGSPAINHAALARQGLHARRRSTPSRRRWPPPSTSSSSSTSGRSARSSASRRSKIPADAARRCRLRPAQPSRLLQGRDRGGQHPCLRRDDAGRRAASEDGASTRCSIAPIPAAASASATSRSRATSA